jgi:malonate decarboxylase delta subunit
MLVNTIRVQATMQRRALGQRPEALVGVNNSGDLEVLVERVPSLECQVEVKTAITGFQALWQAVIQEFFERCSPGGLRFSINDGGARPDTVMLRLMQGLKHMEMDR